MTKCDEGATTEERSVIMTMALSFERLTALRIAAKQQQISHE
jgi:hypothetical protein